MGLDMHLRAEKYISDFSHEEGKNSAEINSILESAGFDRSDVTEDSPSVRVTVNVLYWRKANAIHNWIVENVQDGEDDCGSYHISRDNLGELADTCAEVIKNPNSAEDVMPVTSGFFFGSTEYDEYYFEEIERTRTSLMAILSNPHFDKCEFYYESSW